MLTEQGKNRRKAYMREYMREYMKAYNRDRRTSKNSTSGLRRGTHKMWQREEKVRDVNAYTFQHIPAGPRLVQLFDKIVSGEVRLTV